MEPDTQHSWFQRNPKKTLFTIILLLALALDFGLTGVYHLFKYGTIHKYAERRALRESSPVFHHTLKANARSSAERWGHTGYAVSTNSLGFKDKTTRQVPLSSDRYRILFMGDSFTEGVGYEYEATFVGLVDAALAEADIEVFNAAVSSYSPAIYFKKTDHLLNSVGFRFDHLVVFLDISDIEDEARAYEIRDGRVVSIGAAKSAIKEFLYEYSTLPRNIWNMAAKIHAWMTDSPESKRSIEDKKFAINQQRSLWTIDPVVYSDYGKAGLRKAKHHLDLLYDVTRKHGIAMTLAVYPWPDQIAHRDADSIQVTFWREWADQHGTGFINFFPSFLEEDKDPERVISQYFIEGDCHWNKEGHRLIADNFLKELTEILTPRRAARRAA